MSDNDTVLAALSDHMIAVIEDRDEGRSPRHAWGGLKIAAQWLGAPVPGPLPPTAIIAWLLGNYVH